MSEREGTMWTYDILSRIFLLTPAKTVGTGEGGRRGRGAGRGGDKLDLMHLRVSASL